MKKTIILLLLLLSGYAFADDGGGITPAPPASGLTSGTTVVTGGTATGVCTNQSSTLTCGDACVVNETTNRLTCGAGTFSAGVIAASFQDTSADPADQATGLNCGNNVACVSAELATPGTDKTITLNTSNVWSFVGAILSDGAITSGGGASLQAGGGITTATGQYIAFGSGSYIDSNLSGEVRFNNAGASTASTITEGTKTLTNNSATIFAKVTMTSGSNAGGIVHLSIEDTTTRGVISEDINYAAVDVAGTITCGLGSALGAVTVGGSAGFVLTSVTCADSGSNILDLKATALTTGGTDVLQIKYTIIQNNGQTVTPQ